MRFRLLACKEEAYSRSSILTESSCGRLRLLPRHLSGAVSDFYPISRSSPDIFRCDARASDVVCADRSQAAAATFASAFPSRTIGVHVPPQQSRQTRPCQYVVLRRTQPMGSFPHIVTGSRAEFGEPERSRPEPDRLQSPFRRGSLARPVGKRVSTTKRLIVARSCTKWPASGTRWKDATFRSAMTDSCTYSGLGGRGDVRISTCTEVGVLTPHRRTRPLSSGLGWTGPCQT